MTSYHDIHNTDTCPIISALGFVPLQVSVLERFHRTSNICSMIKRVLGQPNFSPQTNATQLFPQINTNFNNLSSVKVNTIMSVVLSWTNGTSLNFL